MKIINFLNRNNQALLDTGVLLLRIGVGFVLFATGAWKALGWFGGIDLATAVGFYAQSNIGPFLAYLSIFTELIGGVLLVLGLLTRLAAIPVTINMLVATLMTLSSSGLIGQYGAAYPLSLLLGSAAILLIGPMNFSLDRMIEKRLNR